MKKTILNFSLLAVTLLYGSGSQAQLLSFLPEAVLPATPGIVVTPLNTSSSTLQNIAYLAPIANLYVHSWDANSMASDAGIAWRGTNSGGTTVTSGHAIVPYATDIDVALYMTDRKYWLLAGFYYNNGTTKGHYYNIYQFTTAGLVPYSMMNLLNATPSFGRINVDVNGAGGAITWCVPGNGIYVKAGFISGVLGIPFGPNTFIPGTEGYKDPDIAIASMYRNTDPVLAHITYLSNTNKQIKEQSVNFASIAGGGLSGLTTWYTAGTTNTFGVPRIDCPDYYNLPQDKFAVVYTEYTYTGSTASEKILAGVLNTQWSATPTTVTVHSATYNTPSFQQNNPVVCYNKEADNITVGWITKDNTTAISGTTATKYVAQYISDPGTSSPSATAASYMMISGQPGGTFPVLAFSGQNINSDFTGLHTAYVRFNTVFPGQYAMTYKDKLFTSATFREGVNISTTMTTSVFPNPFTDQLSLKLPLKGTYDISITGIDGKVVYTQHAASEAMQQTNINTSQFTPGIYFLHISCAEHQLDETRKLVK